MSRLHPTPCAACKAKAKNFLKRVAQTLASEEKWEVADHMLLHADAAVVEWFICLLLSINTLRDEISAWRPPGYTEWSQTPLMTTEERARWGLSQFAAQFRNDKFITDVIEIARHIDDDEYEGYIDQLCDVLFDIHNLHQEITAWAEFEGVAS